MSRQTGSIPIARIGQKLEDNPIFKVKVAIKERKRLVYKQH